MEGHLFKYYKGQGADGSSPSQLGELKGVIVLHACSVEPVEPKEADGKQFCFKITPASRKVYLIKATDAASRDSWIEAVRASAQLSEAGTSGSSVHNRAETDRSAVRNSVAGSNDSNVTLGDFELLKVIGRGTYGKVMQACVP